MSEPDELGRRVAKTERLKFAIRQSRSRNYSLHCLKMFKIPALLCTAAGRRGQRPKRSITSHRAPTEARWDENAETWSVKRDILITRELQLGVNSASFP